MPQSSVSINTKQNIMPESGRGCETKRAFSFHIVACISARLEPARVEFFCPLLLRPHPHEFEKSCPLPPRTSTLLTRTHPASYHNPHLTALFRSQTRTCAKTTENSQLGHDFVAIKS